VLGRNLHPAILLEYAYLGPLAHNQKS
jgi:hypothetical protein